MRRIVTTLLILCLAVALPHEGFAKARKKAAAPTENDKYAAIVMDAATGQIISQKNADKLRHPASLTKVMTLLLLFDSLENGNTRLNDRLMVSQNAASQQPSKLGLKPGSSIRIEDAIYAVVTKSANDMAVAIGEHLAGSEDRFAARMTRRAHDIGMSNTNFRNASGLHDPQQITTARDMATLARYILIRYPNYYHYFGTKQFTYRGITMTNHNRLMNTYPGMDGFKTGFINASGFNLIASAKQDGRRLIGVVFGGKTWKSRNDQMASLLNDGFQNTPDIRNAQAKPVAPPVARNVIAAADDIPDQKAMPKPAAKPAFAPPNTLQLPLQQAANDNNVISLASLDSGRRLVVPQAQQNAAPAESDVTERAVASVEKAINSGEYSEITGEGDYDPGTTRRVETGLLAAAVYKGEHDKVRQIKVAAAQPNPNPVGQVLQQMQQPQPAPQATVTPASIPAQPAPAVSDLWSVQIGAYTSRVAVDDALRLAASKLPANLNHATPVVVPLKSAEGILFRARLGNFTQAQAIEACRYFRDCLPVAPR